MLLEAVRKVRDVFETYCNSDIGDRSMCIKQHCFSLVKTKLRHIFVWSVAIHLLKRSRNVVVMIVECMRQQLIRNLLLIMIAKVMLDLFG